MGIANSIDVNSQVVGNRLPHCFGDSVACFVRPESSCSMSHGVKMAGTFDPFGQAALSVGPVINKTRNVESIRTLFDWFVSRRSGFVPSAGRSGIVGRSETTLPFLHVFLPHVESFEVALLCEVLVFPNPNA